MASSDRGKKTGKCKIGEKEREPFRFSEINNYPEGYNKYKDTLGAESKPSGNR